MSPVTFKQQIADFCYEINRCILLCKDIRENRNIGSTHNNLDRFQNALESAESSIPTAYSTARSLKGIEMEIGDERARSEMRSHISSVQSIIKPRLKEIARPSSSRPHSGSRGHRGYERERPGFKDLLGQWNIIYDDISATILSLSRRIGSSSSSTSSTGRSSPVPIPKATYVSPPHVHISPASPPLSPHVSFSPQHRKDENTVSRKEYDLMVEHLRISWDEVIVGDEVQYVNCLDPSHKQWIRPANAYIRRCVRQGRRLSRCPSFERRSGN